MILKGSTMKPCLCFLLVFTAGILSASPLPLTAPHAPFVRQKKNAGPGVPVKGSLDAGELIYSFGNKKIIIDQSGTFIFMADGRKIASSYFSARTPAKKWNVNSGKKIVAKYDGSGMSVLSCKADAATGTVTIKGMLGFNKPGTPEEAYPWTRTFSLTRDNKLLVKTVLDVPEKKFRGGIFFSMPMAQDHDIKPVDRGDRRKWHSRTPDITVKNNRPEDSFRIEIRSSMILHTGSKKTSFYLTPENNTWVFAIDPGKCTAGTPHMPGGVDFKRNDDFTLPTTGKNLLPNPYFAQGTSFVKDTTIYFWFTSHGPHLQTKDVKFGKYALNAGKYCTATIPADAGKYVFSIYVKGKGELTLAASTKTPWKNVARKHFSVKNTKEWKRYEFPFTMPRGGMLCIAYTLKGTGVLDGIQLEKGSAATAFSAPAVSARLITDPAGGFFESGKKAAGRLELSTLEKQVAGTGRAVIRNFFGEVIRTCGFKFNFKAGEYPEIDLPLNGLDDGIYVIETSYKTRGSKTAHIEHFRVSVMPFLENKHFTRKIFSPVYDSASVTVKCNPAYIERWKQIGYGSYGHSGSVRPPAVEVLKKHGVEIFDGMGVSRAPSVKIARYFPDLKVPAGRIFFYVKNMEAFFNDFKKNVATLPDYRLTGGWNGDYRKKFKEAVKKEISKGAEAKVYSIGCEWPAEIKNDPHYPDLVNAYFEAVREVFPNAKLAEGGGMNMHPHDGVRQVDVFLERFTGRGFGKPDYLMGHPYIGSSGITQVFNNFKALLKVADKHGMSDCKLAFAEGMHFYPYDIPEWDCRFISAQQWRLRGTFSYDLGWIERLTAAYYTRFYLVHMTEFNRVECVTSAILNTNNFILDVDMVPRASQKITNTLGNLFPHPKRYIGDFSFAPETKCLIWEDHEGRPIAAVWHENEMIDRGQAPSPLAQTAYRGAEYIDMMGVKRKPEVDGTFPVSPFPLFIRGRKGDCDAFVHAMRNAYIAGSDTMPFGMSEKISSDGSLELTLKNDLAGVIKGTLSVGGRSLDISIEPDKNCTVKVPLPEALSYDAVKTVKVPLIWNDGRQTIRKDYSFSAFLVRPFTGKWESIPAIRMTNRIKKRANDDLDASFQLAWCKDSLNLRITVKDNKLSAGSGNRNRYDFDAAQVYIDTLCTGRRSGKKGYDDDDYDYTLMPSSDGRRLEIFRHVSPFMQYTLGTAAPKDNTVVSEFGGTFTRTADGYIYQVAFPAPYVRPVELTPGWNIGFGLMVADRDDGNKPEQHLSLSTVMGKGCYNAPHTWPVAVFADK